MDVIIDPAAEEELLQQWFETTSFVEQEKWVGKEMPDATWADDYEDTYEEKVIRHVRTPAGVARYNQPIGSVIVADGVGNPLSFDVADFEDDAKPSLAMASILQAKEPDPSWSSFSGYGDITHHSTKVGNYNVNVTETDKGSEWMVTFPLPSGGAQVVAEGKAKDALTAKAAASRAARKRRDEYQKRPKSREHGNVFDYWEGVPGYDYWPDGREVTDEDIEKFDDPDYRYDLALKTAQAKGLNVTSDSNSYEMDVNALETVTTLLDTHDRMFPGFTEALVSEIGVKQYKEAIAFNVVDVMPYYQGGDMKTKIMFSPKFYSDRDGAYDALYAMKTKERGWWATDAHELDREYGEEFEKWQLRMLTSATHEIGHTFARIGFGEMSFRNFEANDAHLFFTESLFNMLYNWGVTMDDGMTEEEFRRAVASNRSGRPGMFEFDTNLLREVLSEYGASSLHEMCAEAWAEYMLDPNPRAFALELGTILEETMQMFLETKKA